jgi:hypothetical protein
VPWRTGLPWNVHMTLRLPTRAVIVKLDRKNEGSVGLWTHENQLQFI